jgi:hypothetical protein
MKREKRKLLTVRDIISREIYELENKIIESRIAKLKYKYLEERKELLEEFVKSIDDNLLLSRHHYSLVDENTSDEFPENAPVI